MNKLDYYQEKIEEYVNEGCYPYFPVVSSECNRFVTLNNGKKVRMFASCDYLGFSSDPRIKEAACDAIARFGTNICGSVIFSGYTELHEKFEKELARFFGSESALMFSSSYLANLGVISSVVGKGDIIFADRLNHVSIFHGCVLSGATLRIYKHNDVNHLEFLLKNADRKNIYKNKLIITDGLFSADGDFADLANIVELSKRHHSRILVDEAHSIGTIGANGRGVSEHFNVLDKIDFITGTMNKALGSTGGFLVSSSKYTDMIKHTSGPFYSSRAVPPGVVGASLKSLEILQSEGAFRREKIKRLSALLLNKLKSKGFNVLNSISHIIPVVLGDSKYTAKTTKWLRDNGILVAAMLPLSVPENTARLRLGITCHQEEEDMEYFFEKINEYTNIENPINKSN